MTAPERGEDGTGEHLGGTDPVNSDPDAEDAEVLPPDSTGYSAPPLTDPSTS